MTSWTKEVQMLDGSATGDSKGGAVDALEGRNFTENNNRAMMIRIDLSLILSEHCCLTILLVD